MDKDAENRAQEILAEERLKSIAAEMDTLIQTFEIYLQYAKVFELFAELMGKFYKRLRKEGFSKKAAETVTLSYFANTFDFDLEECDN